MKGLGPTLLVALYIACELIANITAGRTVDFAGISAPGGVFIYALTFTLIDIVNERMGKRGARRVVVAAFAANGLLALYTSLILVLPAPPFFHNQESFSTVFGATPRIIGASLTAFLVSSFVDVEIFAAWKERIGSHKWARVLLSNTVSTGVDSAVFVSLAFAGNLPLVPLIAGQYFIKMAVTVVSIPLIYLAKFIDPSGRNAEPSST